ncbi:hypothetical protein THRCLA_22661 [Thraustotheca clavata]|uniref:Uncharacterized protein n=1 Tax=Thraustotheca clavata TaxID=74557 RepID=A0A1V9YVI5_9STRA|nr:hypothetical protein THRCLA_22661 [Thraustotheca clavata]
MHWQENIYWLAACLTKRMLVPVVFQGSSFFVTSIDFVIEPTIENALFYPAKQFGNVPDMERVVVTSLLTQYHGGSRNDMEATVRSHQACKFSHTTDLICLKSTREMYEKSLLELSKYCKL